MTFYARNGNPFDQRNGWKREGQKRRLSFPCPEKSPFPVFPSETRFRFHLVSNFVSVRFSFPTYICENEKRNQLAVSRACPNPTFYVLSTLEKAETK
jgi:hypothetical protein